MATTARVNYKGNPDGIMVTERFNPQRLREVREEIRYPNAWDWKRKVEQAENRAIANGVEEVIWLLEQSYLENNIGTETIDQVYIMIHQLLVDKNVLDSYRETELPNF